MRTLSAVAFSLLLISCASRDPAPANPVAPASPESEASAGSLEAPAASPVQQRGMGMHRRHMAPSEDTSADDPVLTEGKQVFDEVCAQCHTLDPPPSLAPPMRMVSMHLREAFTDEQGGVDHILSYVPQPEAERSILPAHAIERFGLMAPQPLPAEALEKVARYIWSLGDGMSNEHMGDDEQGGPGMRRRMRRRGGG